MIVIGSVLGIAMLRRRKGNSYFCDAFHFVAVGGWIGCSDPGRVAIFDILMRFSSETWLRVVFSVV